MIIFAEPQYNYLKNGLLEDKSFQSGHFDLRYFSNGEKYIELKTEVAKKTCLIIGSTAPNDSNLFNLLLLINALKTNKANKIIVLIPYLGYSRHDQPGVGKSLALELLGQILPAAGADKVITVNVHSSEAKNFFSIPLKSISSAALFAQTIKKQFTSKLDEITLIAPDEGAIKFNKEIRKSLKLKQPIAYFSKSRRKNRIKIEEFHGQLSKQIIIIDDMLSTGETLIGNVKALRRLGVKDINIFVVHGLFCTATWKKLFALGVKKIYCTDTFPGAKKKSEKRIEVLSSVGIIKDYLLLKK